MVLLLSWSPRERPTPIVSIMGSLSLGERYNLSSHTDIYPCYGLIVLHTIMQTDLSFVYVSGEGDFHDTRFSEYGRTITLAGTVLSGASSRQYDLTLYPTEDFFEVYSTDNPMIAMLGAVLIVFVTSLIFFVYDFVVRREFSANQELLEAKRKFMRFVSHEVRTPLNAVCMGLALLQEELRQTLGRCQSSEGCYGELNKESADATEERELEGCQSSEGCPEESDLESTHVTKERDMIESSLNEWLALTEEICSSANSSVDVLNDLLNYDKIETGSLSLELTVFSIWSLIIETSSEFRLSAKKKMINFELDFSPLLGEKPVENLESIPRQLRERRVVGDLIRITQVLRNLVSNALKFTPVEGKLFWYPVRKIVDGTPHCVHNLLGNLTIQMASVQSKPTDRLHLGKYTLISGEEVALQRSGSVQIKCIDTGAGMSQEQLAALFRDGVQFNVNELQAGQGSGLGLYISKGIVKQHGGDLDVSSEGLGHGSTFTCTLPLYHVPDDSPAETSSVEFTSIISQAPVNEVVAPIEPVESLPLRILVVDDVATNRKLLSRLATKRGHSVDQASDGQEAVHRVTHALRENNRYDTILMDYEMPLLNGPEAAKEIRKLGCDSFIAGITGNLLPEDVNYYLSCGANVVLPKPVDFRKLEALWFERGVLGHTATEEAQ
jgi:signal transduction histidine kinase/CheY-like chemotaxis protein